MKKMRQLVPAIAATAALLLASGCQTKSVQYKQGVDFSRYHSFALAPLPTEGPTSDPNAAVRAAKPAKEAVVATLSAKGFVEAKPENADLLVKLGAWFLSDNPNET
jgi:hypothetical protein